MDLLATFIVAVGIAPVSLLSGWVVARRIKALDPAERFAVAFLPTLALVATAQLVAFIVAPQTAGLQRVVFGLLGVVAVVAVTNPKVRGELAEVPGPLRWATAAALVQLVLSEALRPIYVGGGWYADWWMHFDISRVFVGTTPIDSVWFGGYSLPSRNPFLNLIAASLSTVGADGFAGFQMVCAPLNGLFVVGVYLVARDLGREPSPGWLALLSATNFWMMHNAWYPWPKMLTLYFILLGLHFYLRALGTGFSPAGRGFAGVSLASFVLGALTHQIAVIYAGALGLHAIWSPARRRAFFQSLGPALLRATPALLLALLWYGWLLVEFGVSGIAAASPTQVMVDDHRSPDAFERAIRAVVYLGNSVFGFPAFQDLLAQPSPSQLVRTIFWVYMNLLPGALTLTGSILAVIVARRALRSRRWTQALVPKTPAAAAIATFLVVGVLLGAILHPIAVATGGAHSVFFPATVVFTLIAWRAFSRVSPRVAFWATSAVISEYVCVFWSQLLIAQNAGDQSGNVALKLERGAAFFADGLGYGRFPLGLLLLAIQIGVIAALVKTRPLVAAQHSEVLAPSAAQ